MSEGFTCQWCEGHELKVKVAFMVNVVGCEKDGSLFVLGNDIQDEEVTFFCQGCDYETISPADAVGADNS